MPDNKQLDAEALGQQEAIGMRILGAFQRTNDGWRTAGGVARDSGLPFEAVQSYLRSHPDLFETSSIAPAGMILYALRVDPRTGEPLDRRAREDDETVTNRSAAPFSS